MPITTTTAQQADQLAGWLSGNWFGFAIVAVSLLLVWRFARPLVHRSVMAILGAQERAMPTGAPEDEISKRAATLEDLFSRLVRVLVALAAVFLVFELFDLWPMVAGLGLVLAALTLAGQSVILDYIMGVLILVEGQYYKGDTISVGAIEGTVEEVGLRRTVVRDGHGVVHSISNGTIRVSSNLTRIFAVAVVDIEGVRHGDVEAVIAIMDQVGREIAADPAWADVIVEAPGYRSTPAFTDLGVTLRMSGRVTHTGTLDRPGGAASADGAQPVGGRRPPEPAHDARRPTRTRWPRTMSPARVGERRAASPAAGRTLARPWWRRSRQSHRPAGRSRPARAVRPWSGAIGRSRRPGQACLPGMADDAGRALSPQAGQMAGRSCQESPSGASVAAIRTAAGSPRALVCLEHPTDAWLAIAGERGPGIPIAQARGPAAHRPARSAAAAARDRRLVRRGHLGRGSVGRGHRPSRLAVAPSPIAVAAATAAGTVGNTWSAPMASMSPLVRIRSRTWPLTWASDSETPRSPRARSSSLSMSAVVTSRSPVAPMSRTTARGRGSADSTIARTRVSTSLALK